MDLDWNKEKFLEELDYDQELAGELVKIFLSSSAELLAAMEEALAQGDLALLKEKAHSLKGAAGTIYLEGVQQRALTLERQDLEKEAIRGLLSEIKAQCAALQEAAKELLSG